MVLALWAARAPGPRGDEPSDAERAMLPTEPTERGRRCRGQGTPGNSARWPAGTKSLDRRAAQYLVSHYGSGAYAPGARS